MLHICVCVCVCVASEVRQQSFFSIASLNSPAALIVHFLSLDENPFKHMMNITFSTNSIFDIKPYTLAIV